LPTTVIRLRFITIKDYMLSNEIINSLDKRYEKYTIKTKDGIKFLTNDGINFRMSFESKSEFCLDNCLWVLETDVEFISDNFDMYNYESAEVLGQWFSNKFKVNVMNVSQIEAELFKINAINTIENVTNI